MRPVGIPMTGAWCLGMLQRTSECRKLGTGARSPSANSAEHDSARATAQFWRWSRHRSECMDESQPGSSGDRRAARLLGQVRSAELHAKVESSWGIGNGNRRRLTSGIAV